MPVTSGMLWGPPTSRPGDPTLATALLLNVLIFLTAAVLVVPIIKRLGLGEVLG